MAINEGCSASLFISGAAPNLPVWLKMFRIGGIIEYAGCHNNGQHGVRYIPPNPLADTQDSIQPMVAQYNEQYGCNGDPYHP